MGRSEIIRVLVAKNCMPLSLSMQIIALSRENNQL